MAISLSVNYEGQTIEISSDSSKFIDPSLLTLKMKINRFQNKQKEREGVSWNLSHAICLLNESKLNRDLETQNLISSCFMVAAIVFMVAATIWSMCVMPSQFLLIGVALLLLEMFLSWRFYDSLLTFVDKPYLGTRWARSVFGTKNMRDEINTCNALDFPLYHPKAESFQGILIGASVIWPLVTFITHAWTQQSRWETSLSQQETALSLLIQEHCTFYKIHSQQLFQEIEDQIKTIPWENRTLDQTYQFNSLHIDKLYLQRWAEFLKKFDPEITLPDS